MRVRVNRVTGEHAMHTQQIGYGDFGTSQTVSKMRGLVNQSLTDSLVVQTARNLAASTFARDLDGQVLAIREFLREHFQFVRDPYGVELLVPPRPMLDQIARRGVTTGDCDEAAILGAALGKAIGLRARFVLLGFAGPAGPFTHVYTVLRSNRGWASLDVTKPARGPFPPVARQATVEV